MKAAGSGRKSLQGQLRARASTVVPARAGRGEDRAFTAGWWTAARVSRLPFSGAGGKDGALSSKLLLFVKRGVCQIHFPAVALLHVGFVGCSVGLMPPLGALYRSKRPALWAPAGC